MKVDLRVRGGEAWSLSERKRKCPGDEEQHHPAFPPAFANAR
jgi:hypothetical protein